MPVLVVPYRMPINCPSASGSIVSSIESMSAGFTVLERDFNLSVLLLYELSYSTSIPLIYDLLIDKFSSKEVGITIASLPQCADMINWNYPLVHLNKDMSIKDDTDLQIKDGISKVGGLLVSNSVLSKSNLIVVYVGNKSEQIVDIRLKLPTNLLLSYNPVTDSSIIYDQSVEFCELRERYGGQLRVKDANIIGLIVGSMVKYS